MKPRALILYATGTNRDLDAAAALELAGAVPEIVHINLLRSGERHFEDYQMMVVPGGFSYADALGAGRLFALDLTSYFADQVHSFVDSGMPVIGICNGFQALVKAGILPIPPSEQTTHGDIPATLTFNARGHFECRWVNLLPRSKRCIWTIELSEPVSSPVAHGEGNFVLKEPAQLADLQRNEQIALVYAGPDGHPAAGSYPYNPNGSFADIAGVCNPQGNVLGLMPHPEDHIFTYQHPNHTRGESKLTQARLGLELFKNGVRYVK
jgi:phosphoribosylformylglycinamidine synthase